VASSRHGRFVLVALVIFVVVAGVGTFVLRPTFESRSAPPHKTAGALSAEPLSSNEIVDRLDPPEPMARTRGITIERTASTNTIELVTPQAGDQAGQMFDRADSQASMQQPSQSTEATAPAPGSEPTPEAVPPASGPAVPPRTDSSQLDAQSFQPIPTDPDQLRAFVDELKASRDKGLLKPDIPAVMIADEKTRVTVTLSRGAAGAKVLQEPKLNLRNAGEIAASDFVSVQLA
jgi:hypothetical protein